MENMFNIADWRQQHVKSVMLITEGDTRIKRAEDIIRDAFSGAVDPEGHPLELDKPVKNRNQQINNNPDTTLFEYLFFSLRHDFEIMSNSSASLVPIVAKLAFKDLRYQREDADSNGLQNLRRIVLTFLRDKSSEEYKWFVSKGNEKNYDFKYQEVYNHFKQKLDDRDKADADSANNATGLVRNTHYKIIPINSRKEAEPWGKHTGHGQNGSGRLCFTSMSNMWNQFTAKDTRQCFLLLRDDWEKVPREKTEGYPKDSWGLSMVWVFIDKLTGALCNSNVRWNHGDGSFPNVDNMFTAPEISKLLGMSFKQAFGVEIDRNYLPKAVRALFEKPPTYNYKVFLEDIVYVYKGVTFKDKETGKNYYARNADTIYPIPESLTGTIERDAKEYITKINDKDDVEVYSFEDLRVRKGTVADIPKKTSVYNGALVYGGGHADGKVWYIRNDSAIFEVPKPDLFNIQPDLRFYRYNLPNTRIDLLGYGLFDLKTVTGINMWEHFPEELFRDKETLKALKKDRVCNIVDNVPGLNGMFIVIRNIYGSQYVYLPETGSPVFYHVKLTSPSLEKVLRVNQIYVLNHTWNNNHIVIFDAKSQTFKTFSNKEFAKYLAQFEGLGVSSDEAKRVGVTCLGKNMYLVKGPYEVWVSNQKVSYKFLGLLNSNEKFAYFYRKHDGNSVDGLEFLRLNCNTGELETIGKGLETLHKIWTLFNGTVNVLSNDDINLLYIGKPFNLRIQTYKDDELGAYAILSVGNHSNQIWLLKTGEILPEPGKFYYAATQAYGHNVFIKNTPRDTLHKVSLSSEKETTQQSVTDELNSALQKGASLESLNIVNKYESKVVEGMQIVLIYDPDPKWNYYNTATNRIISEEWFDRVTAFREGYGRVYVGDKGYNFIDKKGKIFAPNTWFVDASERFREGKVRILLNGTMYVMNLQGDLFRADNGEESGNIKDNDNALTETSLVDLIFGKYLL